MKFDEIILKKFELLFKEYSLTVVQRDSNYVEFNSNRIRIVFNFDERERSYSFFVKGSDGFLYPVDEYIFHRLFNAGYWVDNVSLELFVNNLFLFFQSEKGHDLLKGEKNVLDNIKKIVYERGRNYTNKILYEQDLLAADTAWDKKDYKMFVECFNKINNENLPSSYLLKYKISMEKIKANMSGL